MRSWYGWRLDTVRQYHRVFDVAAIQAPSSFVPYPRTLLIQQVLTDHATAAPYAHHATLLAHAMDSASHRIRSIADLAGPDRVESWGRIAASLD